MCIRSFLLVLGVATMATADAPPGMYATTRMNYTDEGLQEGSNITTRKMIVVFPNNVSATDKFPVIAYAHGAAVGGGLISGYDGHFASIASYGFIVIAPDSCNLGCGAGAAQGWPAFQYEQTRALDFAKAQATTTKWGPLIDWDSGVAIAAHSMGGTANLLNSYADVVQKYNIKAAVNQHGFATAPDPTLATLPTLTFTGTADIIVPAALTKATYTKNPLTNKGFRNEKGAGHLEMLTPADPYIAYHTAAWFKVQLLNDKGSFYNDIYGNGPDSFCGSATMKLCEITK